MGIGDYGLAFEAFVARKTAEANAAQIAPLVTEVDLDAASLVAIGNDWTRRLFDGPFYLSPARDDRLPSTNLVFVRSREGNTVAANPSTFGGGDVDKHLLYEGLSRVAVDAVLGGAATIGGGNVVLSIWRRELVNLRASLGLPRHPTQIVATLHGVAIEDGLLFNVSDLPVIVITVARGLTVMERALAARPWITPIVMDTPGGLRSAFQRLREAGINRLSCIGGRTLAEQLIDAALIDDLYLTTTNTSAGEADTPFYSRPLDAEVVVRKRGTAAESGVQFEHLIRLAPAPAA